ncbi:MAG: hypothetical protein A3J74_01860 [Elusimicrobia bacterium RIFCSPHIGHO2_02_FULL_57_9]|nr:MAG: hypothetical protein A3J74_01860 [Elusimicrobia bacterium RIFCSPHIGHO2_02_FULL_57_9]
MRTTALVALALILAACARPDLTGPPQVAFGRQECARCGMIISEERYAAGYVSETGQSVAYDDVGELLAVLSKQPGLSARAWVRDFNGQGWVRAKEASFVVSPGLATPMGSGMAAFADSARAAEFSQARAAGPVRAFSQVIDNPDGAGAHLLDER